MIRQDWDVLSSLSVSRLDSPPITKRGDSNDNLAQSRVWEDARSSIMGAPFQYSSKPDQMSEWQHPSKNEPHVAIEIADSRQKMSAIRMERPPSGSPVLMLSLICKLATQHVRYQNLQVTLLDPLLLILVQATFRPTYQ